MSYTKILETISKFENVGNIGTESRLLNDIKKLNQTGLYKRITTEN